MMFQETTARLLFMAVRWVRCLAPFQTLSKHDQLLLLQESWKELFLLHLAQWSVPWDLSALLGCPQARERLPADLHTATEIKTIQVCTELRCRLNSSNFYLFIRKLCVAFDRFLLMAVNVDV